ncbi:unnamed protein product [Natator depressus]
MVVTRNIMLCSWTLATSLGDVSAASARPRFTEVVYNACNNELVQTASFSLRAPHTDSGLKPTTHALLLGCKKGTALTPEEEEILNKKHSKKIQKKYDQWKNAKISSILEEQFQQGKLIACVTFRPAQCG